MQTRVARWGNSLAVRLPKAAAEEASLHEGEAVDLTVDAGRIIIAPRGRLRLSSLLESVTKENCHEPVDDGGSVGREAW